MKKRNFLTTSRENQYKEQRYKNPLKAKGPKAKKRILALALLIFLLLAAPFLLAYAPIFTLETVEIAGATSISTEEIESIIQTQRDRKRYIVFPQKNSLFFQTDKAQQALHSAFMLENATVETQGKTIRVTIEERIVQIIWQDSDQSFLLDNSGRTLQSLTDEQKSLIERQKDPQAQIDQTEFQTLNIQADIPIIYSLKNFDVQENQPIRDEEFVERIRSIEKILRSKQWKVLYYTLEEPTSDSIKIYTNKGLYIHLNLNDINEPLSLLSEIEITEEIEYIDLRFGNHVYVK